jgi:hypothetical protein
MAEHHLVTRFPWLDGVYSVVRRTGRKTPGLHPYVCPLAPAGSLAACAPPRCLPRRVFYETGTKRGRNRDEIQVRERARAPARCLRSTRRLRDRSTLPPLSSYGSARADAAWLTRAAPLCSTRGAPPVGLLLRAK